MPTFIEGIPQQKEALAVIPIPDNVKDPIINRYVQFTFGRGINETNVMRENHKIMKVLLDNGYEVNEN